MASNLFLSDCGIPHLATAVTLSSAASTTKPVTNLFGGTKADYFTLATAASGTNTIQFTTSGQDADFLYLGKAITLVGAGITQLTVKASNTNNFATATAVLTLTPVTSASLVGPDSDDYVATWASIGSKTYWWVAYDFSTAQYVMHSKLFLGTAFDPGRDPSADVIATRTRPKGAQRRAAYTLELKWEGLTYAKAVSMYQKYMKPRRHNPIILFTSSYHDILFGHRVLFGRVLSVTVPPRVTDFCDVTMTFEEQI
jgi:hypothetical protein